MSQEWDVALTRNGSGSMFAAVPAVVGRTLQERGMHRAKLTITDKGLLLRPYVAPPPPGRRTCKADLPSWDGPKEAA